MNLEELIKELREPKVPSTKTDLVQAPRNTGVPSSAAKTAPPLAVPQVAAKAAAKAASLEAREVLKQRVHRLLVEMLDPERLKTLPEDRQRSELRRVIEQLLDAETEPLSFQQRQALTDEILDDTLGFGPLERLLRDQTISDILINGAYCVYVERNGVLVEEDIHFRDDSQLLEIIQRIVARVGRRINESSPMVDARLPDGSRFNAIVPPLASGRYGSSTCWHLRPLRPRCAATWRRLLKGGSTSWSAAGPAAARPPC
jgi:pilus assembly protein CpaF